MVVVWKLFDFLTSILLHFKSLKKGTLKKTFTQRLARRTREKEERPFKNGWLAEVFGISLQGFYKKLKRIQNENQNQDLILTEVRKIRKIQPKYGTLKLHRDFSFFFQKHQIKMGRDL